MIIEAKRMVLEALKTLTQAENINKFDQENRRRVLGIHGKKLLQQRLPPCGEDGSAKRGARRSRGSVNPTPIEVKVYARWG